MGLLARPIRLGSLRLPFVVAFLIGLTALVSIAGAIAVGGGAGGFVRGGLLIVPLVAEGQVWRLVTHVFIERDPLGLLFAVLMLFWLGRELTTAWGARRFLGAYLGLSAVAAGLTCAVGLLLWPAVTGYAFAGPWAIIDGLLLAFCLRSPGRRISFFGVLPVSGRQLAWITVAGTALFAIFRGPAGYVPHFAAMALAALVTVVRRRPRPPSEPAAPPRFEDWLVREKLISRR